MIVSRRDARALRATTDSLTLGSATPAPVAPAEVPADEASLPLTRASRRVRTRPTAVIADEGPSAVTADERPTAAPDEAPAAQDAGTSDAPHSIPTAAIAWAAAAAAAAAAVEPQPVVPAEPLDVDEPFELLEPSDVRAADGDETEETPDDTHSTADDSDVDEFELAARLFAFTGETPIQSEAAAEGEPTAEEPATEGEASDSAPHVAPRRVRHVGRRVATASFSVGVMGIVGLMAVGMTTPAAAVSAVSGSETTSLVSAQGDVTGPVEKQDIQAYVAPGDVESASLDRPESYSSVSMGQIAAEEGITNYSNFYVNDPNAAIQWPFKVGVGITFGFGMRDGRMHEGADFVPGEGADVQAIADGTVRIATESGGAFGVTVLIDHIIDGQLVSSRYAHMLYGSLRVKAGDHVTVGTILGNTGNTGRSFGAHTHVEILQNGTTPIDPIAWFREYAGRSSLG